MIKKCKECKCIIAWRLEDLPNMTQKDYNRRRYSTHASGKESLCYSCFEIKGAIKQ